MDNIRCQFPELSNMNERIMTEVCNEVKLYQLNALHILRDLQQSYRLCWTAQMTRRCAQMLLKYESIAIIQLYETGMLEENEYSHILKLIESKLFSLEYGNVKMPENQKRMLKNSFDLIPYFESFSPTEKQQWKSLMKSKHKWFLPDSVLLEKDQKVSTAYLIVRGTVQCKHTYYKCGNIIGIDALVSGKTLSYGNYRANGGLVETYLIDSVLLNALLSNEKISRSIYNEIALHTIMNNYQKSLHLNDLQLKMLLNEKVVFYKDKSEFSIHLEKKQRLLLLSGTIKCCSNKDETTLHSVYFNLLTSPTVYQLNSSSIVYTWTPEDEIYCLNNKKVNANLSTENNQAMSAEPFYPHYLGDSIEFTPRRHSLLMTRPIDNPANLQLIPSEIEVKCKQNIPVEFSAL